jgi:stringent starvation protein B
MMTPRRPYFIRAIYEWISDNHLTPYIAVDAELPNVSVPTDYVKDGRIVFDISFTATNKLRTGNDAIEFEARFSGKIEHIYIPINAVMAIYAKENSLGMVFTPEDIENYKSLESDSSHEPITSIKKKFTHLKLIQDQEEDKEID